MDEQAQVAMDGSPGRVQRWTSGKFDVTNPDVGTSPGVDPWLRIKWQVGPLQEVGINGGSIEDVIDVCVERLEGFQKGPFKCRENALAITKLEEAKLWLLYRTQKRQAQGVEGTNTPHVG